MIVVTGATGQLGQLVIDELLQKVPAAQIVAAVRNPAKAAALAAKGVRVRAADYDQPASWDTALAGATKVLLISGNEVGKRTAQHRNVIAAAKRANVQLLAYTSILHQPTSPMGLAKEHGETEAVLKEMGVPHVLLRNGWYIENYLSRAPGALAAGVLVGSSGVGRISAATRADFAAAAAAVLTTEGQAGRVYELAGDEAFTMADLAAELSRQTGRQIPYQDLPEAEFAKALQQVGLPDWLAAMLAASDVGVSKGGLFDDSHQLSKLIGRATTPLSVALKASLS